MSMGAGKLVLAGACGAVLGLGGCNWSGHDYARFRVPSASMEPTIHVGQRVDVDRVAYQDAEPKRGDIVVLRPPAGAETQRCGAPHSAAAACAVPFGGPVNYRFIKRIVALPGDRLKIVGNRVYLNGRRARETSIRTSPCNDICNLRREITIPPGYYFTLGDNRGESDDSRSWGPVRKAWIVGKVHL